MLKLAGSSKTKTVTTSLATTSMVEKWFSPELICVVKAYLLRQTNILYIIFVR